MSGPDHLPGLVGGDPLAAFSEPVRAWFSASFPHPTDAQAAAWPAIAAGEHTLLCAPTGSGKTLAAFLWALDDLGRDPDPEPGQWVDAWFRVEIDKMQKQIDRQLLPVFVEALPGPEPDTTPPIREEVTDLGEGSHLSYALQWFSFAVILVITYSALTWQEYKHIKEKD